MVTSRLRIAVESGTIVARDPSDANSVSWACFLRLGIWIVPLGTELGQEISAGDEETRHVTRVHHEDVIARLTIIREGQPPAAASRPRGRSQRRKR